MIVFTLLLLISFAFADAPPTCEELPKLALDLEKELKGMTAPKCSALKLSDFSSLPGDGQEITKDFNAFKCAKFSAIEARIAKLENQHALLKGFEVLKNEIKVQKDWVEKSTGESAQQAGRKFVDALNTAHSVEQLLALPDAKLFLKILKTVPEHDRADAASFQAKVDFICGPKQGPRIESTTIARSYGPVPRNGKDACGPGFKLSDAAVKDLNALLKQPFEDDPEMLGKWQAALKIKKLDDSEYSFTQMAEEFKKDYEKLLNKDIHLSKGHLKAITSLPDFKDAPAGLEFLKELRDLNGSRDVVAGAKFKYLVEDLKERQAAEVTAKLSLTVHEYSKDMNEEQKKACEEVHTAGIAKAGPCLSALESLRDAWKKNGTTGDRATHLVRMIGILGPSMSYHDKLIGIENVCLNEKLLEVKEKADLSAECQEKLNYDLGELSLQIEMLKKVQEKIVVANSDLMNFREFALFKWQESCGQGVSLEVGECDTNFEDHISREAIGLTDGVAKIAMTYVPPAVENEHAASAEALCSDETAEIGAAKRLCLFFNSDSDENTDGDGIDPVDHSGAHYMYQMEANGGENSDAKAWASGLGKLAQGLSQMLQPKPQMPPPGMNPYYYGNNPYYGAPMLGISDQILYNARYYGAYGYYGSTPGLTPYTAFPTAPTGYSSLGSSRSPYFTGR